MFAKGKSGDAAILRRLLVVGFLLGLCAPADAKWTATSDPYVVTDGTWTLQLGWQSGSQKYTDGDGNAVGDYYLKSITAGPEGGGDLDMSDLTLGTAPTAVYEAFIPTSCEKFKVTSIKFNPKLKVLNSWCGSWFSGNVPTLLTNVVFGAQMHTIGSHAFANCPNLVSVSGLDNVKYIQQRAFVDCPKLKTIEPYLPATLKSIASDAFTRDNALTGDLVYRSEEYRNVTVLPGRPKTVVFNDAITNLNINFAYAGLESVGSFPASLQTVGACFQDWNDPRLGDQNLHLAADFSACTNLTVLPNGFAGGSLQLRSVTLPPRIRSIDTMAFYDCGKLTNVFYAVDLRFRDEMLAASGTVGVSAFQNCTSLRSVEFPWGGDSTTVGENCFAGVYTLNRLKFHGRAPKSIAQSAFAWVNGTSGALQWGLRIYGSSRQDRAGWLAFRTREPSAAEKTYGSYPGPKTFGVYEYDYTDSTGTSKRNQWLVWEKGCWDLPQGLVISVR